MFNDYRLLLTGLVMAGALAAQPQALAAGFPCSEPQGDIKTCAVPQKYRITVYEVGVCSDISCGQKQVLGTSTRAFDFAAVTPGADVGSFSGADVKVNPGNYSHIYMIWGADVVIRGRVTLQPGGVTRDCITSTSDLLNPGGDPIARGLLVAPGSGSPSDITLDLNRGLKPGEGFTDSAGLVFTVLNDSQFQAVMPMSQAVTVRDGASLNRITISFGVGEGIGAYAYSQDGGLTYECGIAIAAPSIKVRQD